MELHGKNKRAEERFSYLKTIKYICIPDGGEDFRGVTIDISKSGLSLYIFTPRSICEGLRLEVKDELPVSSQTGTIKWVHQVDRDLYRAGLRFN